MLAESSNKPLKESNIFRRTLGAESIGLEKIPSQSPAVTLSGGGEVRSPTPKACKSAAFGTDLTNSEKVQIHKLAEGVGFVPTVLSRVQRFSSLMAAVLPCVGPV